jgi:hypothetical protein
MTLSLLPLGKNWGFINFVDFKVQIDYVWTLDFLLFLVFYFIEEYSEFIIYLRFYLTVDQARQDGFQAGLVDCLVS